AHLHYRNNLCDDAGRVLQTDQGVQTRKADVQGGSNLAQAHQALAGRRQAPLPHGPTAPPLRSHCSRPWHVRMATGGMFLDRPAAAVRCCVDATAPSLSHGELQTLTFEMWQFATFRSMPPID